MLNLERSLSMYLNNLKKSFLVNELERRKPGAVCVLLPGFIIPLTNKYGNFALLVKHIVFW